MSGDGGTVAVAGAPTGGQQGVIYDIAGATSTLVSPPNLGLQYTMMQLGPIGALSGDGRYVVYSSSRAGTNYNTYNGEGYVQRIK